MNVNLNTQYAALRSSANDLDRLARVQASSVTQLATGSRLPDPTALDSQPSSVVTLRNSGLRLRSVESGIVNAISFLETQASVFQNMAKLTNRMSELASQMVDPSKNAEDKQNYLKEFTSLQDEFSLYRTAQFNGTNLFVYLSGDTKVSYDVAVGDNGGSTVAVSKSSFRNADQGISYVDFLGDITTETAPYSNGFGIPDPTDPSNGWGQGGQEGFSLILQDLASRMAQNQSEQGQLRLNLDKLRERILVTDSTLSRVSDVDVASELTTLARSDMQLRGAVATKTQSNVFADSALKLLSNQDFSTPLIQEARLSPAWSAMMAT